MKYKIVKTYQGVKTDLDTFLYKFEAEEDVEELEENASRMGVSDIKFEIVEVEEELNTEEQVIRKELSTVLFDLRGMPLGDFEIVLKEYSVEELTAAMTKINDPEKIDYDHAKIPFILGLYYNDVAQEMITGTTHGMSYTHYGAKRALEVYNMNNWVKDSLWGDLKEHYNEFESEQEITKEDFIAYVVDKFGLEELDYEDVYNKMINERHQ